jgi:hypothetical protein
MQLGTMRSDRDKMQHPTVDRESFRFGALAGRLLFSPAAGMTTRGYWRRVVYACALRITVARRMTKAWRDACSPAPHAA